MSANTGRSLAVAGTLQAVRSRRPASAHVRALVNRDFSLPFQFFFVVYNISNALGGLAVAPGCVVSTSSCGTGQAPGRRRFCLGLEIEKYFCSDFSVFSRAETGSAQIISTVSPSSGRSTICAQE